MVDNYFGNKETRPMDNVFGFTDERNITAQKIDVVKLFTSPRGVLQNPPVYLPTIGYNAVGQLNGTPASPTQSVNFHLTLVRTGSGAYTGTLASTLNNTNTDYLIIINSQLNAGMSACVVSSNITSSTTFDVLVRNGSGSATDAARLDVCIILS